ncbi:MAG: hypothetical protein IJR91_05205 [Ruminococcus sp.]|nr:hypothetical protein [Ruminococcus sp.]
MTTRKKKSSREKRVLIASVIVAATIVAGSTFAWFTSKDEVTNRLTAKADYGVSITEDFTPPEDWTPGQEINKDVSAVNTGNIDAYMRMKLSYALKGKAIDPAGVAIATTVPENAIKIDTTKQNWRETYQTGELVVLAGTAVSENDTKINVDGTAQETNDGKADAEFRDGAVLVNSKNYTPQTAGLYIFRRQIEDMASETPKYSFSGYYFNGTDYYKLNTVIDDEGSVTVDIVGLQGVTDSVPTANQITAVKLAAIKDLPAISAQNTTAVLDANTKTIKLTYGGADGDTSTAKDNIIIDIKLDDDYAANWTYLNDSGNNDTKTENGWFYYNDKIAAGATTAKLVDSVKLDETVVSGAYTELTFDLTAALTSVQVEKKEDGTYGDTTAKTLNENASVATADGKPTWNATAVTPGSGT